MYKGVQGARDLEGIRSAALRFLEGKPQLSASQRVNFT